jgi:hypothetical protein
MPGRRLAATFAAAAAAALAGCGGESDPNQVRDVVTRFAQATAKKDYQQICDELISRRLAETVEQFGLPCELAFRRGLQDVRYPKLRIVRVQVKKDRAFVAVRTSASNQMPSKDTLELVREDGQWRIAALSGARPPGARPPATRKRK